MSIENRGSTSAHMLRSALLLRRDPTVVAPDDLGRARDMCTRDAPPLCPLAEGRMLKAIRHNAALLLFSDAESGPTPTLIYKVYGKQVALALGSRRQEDGSEITSGHWYYPDIKTNRYLEQLYDEGSVAGALPQYSLWRPMRAATFDDQGEVDEIVHWSHAMLREPPESCRLVTDRFGEELTKEQYRRSISEDVFVL